MVIHTVQRLIHCSRPHTGFSIANTFLLLLYHSILSCHYDAKILCHSVNHDAELFCVKTAVIFLTPFYIFKRPRVHGASYVSDSDVVVLCSVFPAIHYGVLVFMWLVYLVSTELL